MPQFAAGSGEEKPTGSACMPGLKADVGSELSHWARESTSGRESDRGSVDVRGSETAGQRASMGVRFLSTGGILETAGRMPWGRPRSEGNVIGAVAFGTDRRRRTK